MSLLEGNEIRSVRYNGGLVVGQPLTVELHLWGGVVTLTKPSEVDFVRNTLSEASRLEKRIGKPIDRMNYLRWNMIEEGIL